MSEEELQNNYVEMLILDLEKHSFDYWESTQDEMVEALRKLQQENTKYKEVIDKAIEYINDNLIISSILDGKKYYTINNYSFDYRELLDILKEVK